MVEPVQRVRLCNVGGAALSAYVILCLAAVAALPIVTAMRLMRPKPRALGKVQSETVDVVKQLGGPPAGVGKRAVRHARPK